MFNLYYCVDTCIIHNFSYVFVSSIAGQLMLRDGNTSATNYIQEGDHPLYPGAKLTKGESLTSLLGYMLRHHVTKSAFQDLLHLLKMLLPDNSFPSTNYLFSRAFETNKWQVHHYCLNPDCGSYIGILDVVSAVCPMCNTECKVSEHLSKGYYFMYSPLRDEIKNQFENHNLKDKLSQKKQFSLYPRCQWWCSV